MSQRGKKRTQTSSPEGGETRAILGAYPQRLMALWVALVLILNSCQARKPIVPVTGGGALAVEKAVRMAPPLPDANQEIPPDSGIYPQPTPNPYIGLSIEDLAGRPYGGGAFEIVKSLAENQDFTRYLIRYPSDSLSIYGFMDVPKRGAPPYPVIIAIHGYVDPQRYQTLDYTTGYADGLARAGYLVIHPNLRGYPPSDNGPNLFRVGMAIDVLNLISLVKDQGGIPGPLEMARNRGVGLWGHSMGAGIALRVATVNPDIKAVFLYSTMSADEWQNYAATFKATGGTQGYDELLVPEQDRRHISPVYYLDRIQAVVSIHYGEADVQNPPAWSQDLCQELQDLQKQVECFAYPGQPHFFEGTSASLLLERAIAFYRQNLE